MTKPVNIPKDAIFTITTGEYSDYTVSGVFRALKEIDVSQLAATFFAQYSGSRDSMGSAFIPWLAQQNVMEQVHSFELHLDDGPYSKPLLVPHLSEYDGVVE